MLRITAVKVEGARAVDPFAVEQLVWDTITGSYFYLFSKQAALLYPKKTLARKVLTDIPAIETVSVKTHNRNTLVVSIGERQPAALWCGESAASSSPCLFIDQNGFAYAQAPEYSGDAYQKYYGALALGGASSGQFLPRETFRSFTALVGALQKQISLTLLYSAIEKNQDVQMVFAGGFTLRIPLDADNAATVERLTLALTAPVFEKHTLRELEYLDLRFGDKLYYKLKGASQ